jgi:hypothetical protein
MQPVYIGAFAGARFLRRRGGEATLRILQVTDPLDA